jgi:hypothetical protein
VDDGDGAEARKFSRERLNSGAGSRRSAGNTANLVEQGFGRPRSSRRCGRRGGYEGGVAEGALGQPRRRRASSAGGGSCGLGALRGKGQGVHVRRRRCENHHGVVAEADVVQVAFREVHTEDASHGEVVDGKPLDAEAAVLDLGHAEILAAHRHAAGVATNQAWASVRLQLGTLVRRQRGRVNEAVRRAGVDVYVHGNAVDEEGLDEVRLGDATFVDRREGH